MPKKSTTRKKTARRKSATESKPPWYDEWAEVIFGGNTKDLYNDGDIICSTSDHMYQMPEDVREMTETRLQEAIEKMEKEGRPFYNNTRIRLKSANIGSRYVSSDDPNKPLRLAVEQTEHYSTFRTNKRLGDNPPIILPGGKTIKEKYAGDIHLSDSQLSDPIAVNLSVVTSDDKIFVSKRSPRNAFFTGIYLPAVSGHGTPDDIVNGNYDPFLTAIRISKKMVTGEDYKIERDMITFFGFAKTHENRLPFLFGELRLPITSEELKTYSIKRKENWKGKPVVVSSFTIEDVTDWIKKNIGVEKIETTFFSLYQSLLYQYPKDIEEIHSRLKSKQTHDTGKELEVIYELLVAPFMYRDYRKIIDLDAKRNELEIKIEQGEEKAKEKARKFTNKDILKILRWWEGDTMLSKSPYKEFIELCRKIQKEDSKRERNKLKKSLFEEYFRRYSRERYEEEKQEAREARTSYTTAKTGKNIDKEVKSTQPLDNHYEEIIELSKNIQNESNPQKRLELQDRFYEYFKEYLPEF